MIIKKIFDRFKMHRKTVNTPLEIIEKVPWSEVVKACYDKNLNFTYPVTKVIYTDDKTERAVILQKPNMSYTIAIQKLYPFDDEELKYTNHSLPGFWSPGEQDIRSIYDTEERAVNAIFAEPPFKYNKCIVWADFSFRIDVESLCWIKNDGADDPADLCLHGHVVVKIGEEIFEYNATVSAASLYLLRTLTENHIIHNGEAMLPCCGHSMFANDDLRSVDIYGCSNGIDWSAIHEDGKIKLVTEADKITFIDIDDYRDEVYAFANKVEAFYKKCSPKNMPTDEFERNGYIAFWNEWRKRRNTN